MARFPAPLFVLFTLFSFAGTASSSFDETGTRSSTRQQQEQRQASANVFDRGQQKEPSDKAPEPGPVWAEVEYTPSLVTGGEARLSIEEREGFDPLPTMRTAPAPALSTKKKNALAPSSTFSSESLSESESDDEPTLTKAELLLKKLQQDGNAPSPDNYPRKKRAVAPQPTVVRFDNPGAVDLYLHQQQQQYAFPYRALKGQSSCRNTCKSLQTSCQVGCQFRKTRDKRKACKARCKNQKFRCVYQCFPTRCRRSCTSTARTCVSGCNRISDNPSRANCKLSCYKNSRPTVNSCLNRCSSGPTRNPTRRPTRGTPTEPEAEPESA